MTALLTPDSAMPSDLPDRVISNLFPGRSRFAMNRTALALAATVTLAATGYVAQRAIDPAAQSPLVMLSITTEGETILDHGNVYAYAPGGGGVLGEKGKDARGKLLQEDELKNNPRSRPELSFDASDAAGQIRFGGKSSPAPSAAAPSATPSEAAAADTDGNGVGRYFQPGGNANSQSAQEAAGQALKSADKKEVGDKTKNSPQRMDLAQQGASQLSVTSSTGETLLVGGQVLVPNHGSASNVGMDLQNKPVAAQQLAQLTAQPPAQSSAPASLLQSQKVIRSGKVEYEVESFDSALMTLTKIVIEDGGFVASTDSAKLPNGKARGVVTVRVPPGQLDAFVLKLRGLGDLKSQQISAQDVGKQYTDIESGLKAARAMEERLLDMIKNGKGSIKDLLAAEKELGTWREKIEKYEGEKRYFDNLISLSTLAITLQERDIKAATGAIETETISAGVETDDVLAARTALLKAIDDAKGRVIAADMNQLQGGQLAAAITADVPADQGDPLTDRLKQLGKVARLDVNRNQTTQDGSSPPTPGTQVQKKPTRLVVQLYNLANVAPRTTVQMNLAATDVEAGYRAALVEITKAGGRVTSSALSRPGDGNLVATISADVPTPVADAATLTLRALGEVTRLQQTDNPDQQNTTLAKRGITMEITPLATAVPRNTLALQIAAKDVSKAYQSLLQLSQNKALLISESNLEDNDKEKQTGRLTVDLPNSAVEAFEAELRLSGDTLRRNVTRLNDQQGLVESKTRYTLTLLPADRLPPRKLTNMTIHAATSADGAGNDFQLFARQVGGRVIDASVARDAHGGNSARVSVDVPLDKSADALAWLIKAGETISQTTNQSPEAPDGPLARARFVVTFAVGEGLVGADQGIWASIQRGLSTSLKGLAWSVQLIVIGLCLVLPWAVIGWAAMKVVKRRRVKA